MTQLYAVIEDIGYDTMAATLRKKKEHGVLHSILSAMGIGLLTHPFILRKAIEHPTILKHQIKKHATEHGINLSILEIGEKVLEHKEKRGKKMLDISISIKSIDYNKLSSTIGETAHNAESMNNTVSEVAKIVKPFISETMATIPIDAIPKLFELLGKDKVVEMAEKYGVVVDGVALDAG